MAMASENQRYCRKCLLEDMKGTQDYENMHRYIRQLDREIRADDRLYRYRLHQCRQCDRLLNGMCRICGCFVEMRAAIKVKSCPDVVPKW